VHQVGFYYKKYGITSNLGSTIFHIFPNWEFGAS